MGQTCLDKHLLCCTQSTIKFLSKFVESTLALNTLKEKGALILKCAHAPGKLKQVQVLDQNPQCIVCG